MFSMVVIDSIAALLPEIELKGEISDKTIGEQARLTSRALRKIIPLLHKTQTLLIVTNQLREKVGIIFGNPEITPGGRALRFYASLRLEVRKGENIIHDQQLIGHKMKVKVTKNKLSIPFQVAELPFLFNQGFCKINELIELAINEGIITKNGT
jgi:recombination protein RecA